MPLTGWLDLREYVPADDIRKTLKLLNRQYIQFNKMFVAQKNNLISVLDSVFSNANKLFTSQRRESDGNEKWIDFISKFWHIDCVSKLFLSAFKLKYQSWCKKNGYYYSESKAVHNYEYAKTQVSVLPANDSVKLLVTTSISQVNSLLETLAAIRNEMDKLSSQLPEYDAVMSLYGVGKVFCSQLIAEIGDIRRLNSSKSIVALAGIDPPPDQSQSPEAFQNVALLSSEKRFSRLCRSLFRINHKTNLFINSLIVNALRANRTKFT